LIYTSKKPRKSFKPSSNNSDHIKKQENQCPDRIEDSQPASQL